MTDLPAGRAFALYLPALGTSSELPPPGRARRSDALAPDSALRADIELCMQVGAED